MSERDTDISTDTAPPDPAPARAASVQAGEKQFQLLVHSVRDYAILLLDPAGRVVSWNEGAERIKGWSADEILGESFERFYPEEAVAIGFPRHELEVAARVGRFEDENWRVRKDGSKFWANVVITALHGEDGALVGYAKVTRDLTARREAEEQARRLAAERAAHAEAAARSQELERLNGELRDQAALLEEQTEEARVLAEHLGEANRHLQAALADARRAKEAAEEAYRDLDQFAYVASHDLKAPLRGIGNLAQWLADDLGDRLDERSREHMRLLQGRVQRMEALIDGILAYSRAGRRLTEPERVDLGALLREVIDLQAPPDTVEIALAPDLPTIEAERVPLQQVLMNLIGNAVKYSAAHRDDVRVAVEWRDLGAMIELAVRDNGPGIAPEYHDRIWGIFQTLAARDKVEGTGIGLSVVKKIVESRGGAVTVESAAGAGATFRLRWPKAQETAA
ncbi:MAG TPA: ATP-binding protein [Solirubrobacterales bacterium]|nr:ATP-binding protein [Solirubrobacterales bacterium]